jgi:integron integrase
MDRVRQAIRVRHYSRRTEEAYVHWIRRYIMFHRKAHPSEMGAAEISTFLTWLAVERHLSASTQSQALSALLFLYRDVLGIELGLARRGAARPATDPGAGCVEPRRSQQRPEAVDGTIWIIVVILYGAGLRIQDCLALRVKDIDFDRHQIVVRRGKGQKDVRTMLPVAVRDRLRTHLEEVKRQHERDLERGVGRAVLPFALDRKYPNASTDWAWQFVFPAARICRDPQWGPPSRFHLHESVVQREVAAAVRRAGLTKRVSPHVFGRRLRHPDGAGTARASRRHNNDDLLARPQSGGVGSPQPCGSAVTGGRPGF